MKRDIKFDYDTGKMTTDTVEERGTVIQTIMNRLKTIIGELLFDNYEDFGSNMYGYHRKPDVEDEEVEQTLNDALEPMIEDGTIDDIDNIIIKKDKATFSISFSVRRNEDSISIII